MTVEAYISIIISLVAATVKTVNTADESTSPFTFAKAIADYGITILISAVFLYAAFRLINIFLRHIEGKLDNKQHDKLLDMRTQVGEEVQERLEEFVTRHKGERAQVIEFSNTVMSVAYLPFKYMTCTYEVCSFGIVSKGHMVDHMSTSLFTNFFKNLQQDNYSTFDVDNHNLLVGGAIYDLMNTMEQQKTICSMLTTSSGKAIGYVSFQKDAGFDAEDIQGIQQLSKEISALLGIMDN